IAQRTGCIGLATPLCTLLILCILVSFFQQNCSVLNANTKDNDDLFTWLGKRGVAVAHLASAPGGPGSNPGALTLPLSWKSLRASVIHCSWKLELRKCCCLLQCGGGWCWKMAIREYNSFKGWDLCCLLLSKQGVCAHHKP